ncbi:hypothetical protein VI817_001055 [Penicillium citrinum]|nr:hypothetical protein VI817_001055 [Penicillium citrinum]
MTDSKPFALAKYDTCDQKCNNRPKHNSRRSAERNLPFRHSTSSRLGIFQRKHDHHRHGQSSLLENQALMGLFEHVWCWQLVGAHDEV